MKIDHKDKLLVSLKQGDKQEFLEAMKIAFDERLEDKINQIYNIIEEELIEMIKNRSKK